MKKNNNGFTLVELLAVIVILALIMAIAIPSILSTTNNAKKESFYLYAQSLQSKAISAYTQDIEEDKENAECVVYDIAEDLGISNVGDYEGWVKVSREAVKNSKRVVTYRVNEVPGGMEKLEYVNYCVARENCNPDVSYNFSENSKEIIISETINENQVLCGNYQYNDGKMLYTSETTCLTFADGEEIVEDYKYSVILTFKDNNYLIQNVEFSDKMAKKEFYKILDANKKEMQEKISKKEANPMLIASPTCTAGEDIEYKGYEDIKEVEATTTTTTTKDPTTCPVIQEEVKSFDVILNPNGGVFVSGTQCQGNNCKIKQCVDCTESNTIPEPTRSGYIFEGWYYEKTYTTKLIGNQTDRVNISKKTNTANCVIGYNDVNLYAKWKIDPASTTTTTQRVEEITTSTTTDRSTTIIDTTTTTTRQVEIITTTTTTIDTTDYTLLLDTLNVAGYNIGFSPIKFYYELTIPTNVNELSITYQAHTPEVTEVQVTNNTDLKPGDTWVSIILHNTQTGRKSYYKILVKKLSNDEGKITTAPPKNDIEWDPESGIPDPTLEESNASLRNLLVGGYKLDFDPNVYEYTLKVYETKELYVTFDTVARNAIVYIEGADAVKDGSTITVFVRSENGYYNKTYKIHIKFMKETSENTKFLRNASIIMGIALIIIVAITATNKKKNINIIKKKNNINDNPDNIV